jgi:pimeloyl-ACP methyl ester carboxylesterase
MSTSFVRGLDGARIAYETAGSGRPLVLLHGGFQQDRRDWRRAGYVDRLAGTFRLVLIDLRGHGESDHPTTPEAYSAEAVCGDVTAVLDAEGIDRARVWGFSLGASVALQLAIAGDRVERAALAGAALGPWLTAEAAAKMVAGVQTLAQAKAANAIDAMPIPDAHKEFAKQSDLDVVIAYYPAMARWPAVEPEAIRCPALFYAGSKNALGAGALASYGDRLRKSGASIEILEGLDHMGEFNSVDRSLPLGAAFFSAP